MSTERNVPFKPETWPNVDGRGDIDGKPYLCEICGTPCLTGSWHRECGIKRDADKRIKAFNDTYDENARRRGQYTHD